MNKFVKYAALAVLALFVGSLAFAAAATASTLAGAPAVTMPAASGASSPDTLSVILDMVRPIYDAFAHGSYVYAGALALVLAVALTKRYLGDRVPWLHTDAGGATMTLAGAFGAALAAALTGGIGVSTAILWHALVVAVGAAGGYSLVRHLLIPPLRKLAAKCPAWSQPAFALVFWIFDHPDEVAAKATAAGDAAVAANPGKGVAAIVGQARDVK